MFFYLSKIAWFFLTPFTLIFFVLLLGYLLLFKWEGKAKVIIGVGLILLLLVGFSPISRIMMGTLESQILVSELPDRIDGVIVLTGVMGYYSNRPSPIELYDSADRIIEGIRLVHKHPEAQLIISGWSGSFDQSNIAREADHLRDLSVSLGIAPDRILVERNSRNTYEEAVEMAKILKDRKGNWVLVTSAYHMLRSVKCFEKQGLHVIPRHVDFYTSGKPVEVGVKDFVPNIHAIEMTHVVVREIIGLVAYKLNNYID